MDDFQKLNYKIRLLETSLTEVKEELVRLNRLDKQIVASVDGEADEGIENNPVFLAEFLPYAALDSDLDVMKILNSEKYRVMVVLQLTRTNLNAAKMLGMSERTFYRKLKKYKLNAHITPLYQLM